MLPKKAYDDHKRHSDSREILWEFSYEEWLEMWLVSGKWNKRGRKKGQYCMCRYGDTGSYSPRNCYIDLTNNNQQVRWEDARKLLPQKYIDIVRLWYDTSLTQYEIARQYDVDQSYVSKIISKYKKVLNV